MQSRGEGETVSQVINAYDTIVQALYKNEKRLDIPRRLLGNMLTVEMGITKHNTISRHIDIMVELGYLSVAQRGFGPESMKYDLVYSKILQLQRQVKL